MKLKLNVLFFILVGVAVGLSAQQLEPRKDGKTGKWGYVEKGTEKWVVKPKYETAEKFEARPNGKKTSLVTLKGKQGFVDESGKELGAGIVFEKIEPIIRGISPSNTMFVTVKDKKGLIDYEGVYIIKPELTEVVKFNPDKYFVKKKNKIGLINVEGSYLLDLIYDEITPAELSTLIIRKGGKTGLADREGKIILEPIKYTDIAHFELFDWIIYKKEKKGLYRSLDNKVIIEPEYNEISHPVSISGEEYYKVRKNSKWGLVDNTGKRVLKCNSKRLYTLPYGVYANKSYLDGEGIFFLPSLSFRPAHNVTEKKMGPFNEISISTDNGVYLVAALPSGLSFSINNNIEKIGDYYLLSSWDKNNEKSTVYSVFSLECEPLMLNSTSVPQFVNNWLVGSDEAISKDNTVYKNRVINNFTFIEQKDGKGFTFIENPTLNNEVFEDIAMFKGFEAVNVKKNGKWGLLLKEGLLVDYISETPLEPFSNVVYLFSQNGKKGIVNNESKVMIESIYDDIKLDKSNRDLIVYDGKKTGCYSLTNNSWVISPTDMYNSISSLSKDSYLVENDHKYGVIGSNGKAILPIQFKEIKYSSGDYYTYEASIGNAVKFFDKNGKQVKSNPSFTLSEAGVIGNQLIFVVDYKWVSDPNVKAVIKVYYLNGSRVNNHHDTKKYSLNRFGQLNVYSALNYHHLPRHRNYKACLYLYDSKGKEIPMKEDGYISFHTN